MTLTRRRALQAAATAPIAALARPAIAQGRKQVSILTWNIPNAQPLMATWIKDFTASRPGVEVQWLDKKGPDLPSFYQTQLVAGTPPDLVDLQGGLGVEYAAQGALADITPHLAADPGVRQRFNADYLANWVYDGRNYMLPFYIAKTLLFYNRTLFNKAGIEAPAANFDGLMQNAAKLGGGNTTGFLTLNFDWLYWPLFKVNGIELLSPDHKQTRFDTPKMADLVARLAKATETPAIDKISWTGRWVEPLGAFASGRVGMLHAHSPAYLYIKGQGPWVSADTLGVAEFPGNWSVPNSHGLGISKQSRNPDLAWELLTFLTDRQQALAFARSFKVLTGNIAVDHALLDELKTQDPLGQRVLQTQIEHTDRLCGNWRLGDDSRVKDAFWPHLQAALLGHRKPEPALRAAKREVQRVLRRG
jgi:ABC-type glycerol-3-phosphate transport system substrate-binding protein